MICQSDENTELTTERTQEDESSLHFSTPLPAGLQTCSTPCDETPCDDADAAAISAVDSRRDAALCCELASDQCVCVCMCVIMEHLVSHDHHCVYELLLLFFQ